MPGVEPAVEHLGVGRTDFGERGPTVQSGHDERLPRAHLEVPPPKPVLHVVRDGLAPTQTGADPYARPQPGPSREHRVDDRHAAGPATVADCSTRTRLSRYDRYASSLSVTPRRLLVMCRYGESRTFRAAPVSVSGAWTEEPYSTGNTSAARRAWSQTRSRS